MEDINHLSRLLGNNGIKVTSNNNCFFSETGQFCNVENARLDKDYERFIAWIKHFDLCLSFWFLLLIWMENNCSVWNAKATTKSPSKAHIAYCVMLILIIIIIMTLFIEKAQLDNIQSSLGSSSSRLWGTGTAGIQECGHGFLSQTY